MAQKGGPCYRGQQLLDNAPCQAAVNRGSRALLFSKYRALLIQYLTTENKHFQPMGANMGVLPPLPEDQRPRDKRLRYMAVAERAVASFQQWLDETSL